MAVLGLVLVLLVAALVVGVVYDNGAATTLHVFGVGIDANVISVFLVGAAAMFVLLLGLWLLSASARRARRNRRERKAMEREREQREAELEQERARLAEERERLDAERTSSVRSGGAHDRGDRVHETGMTREHLDERTADGRDDVDLRGRHSAVRSDTVYDPAARPSGGVVGGVDGETRPVRPADDPARRR